MKEFLFFMANFLDFWFLPFIIMFIVSIVVEQVVRRLATSVPLTQDDEKKIETAMRVRKFLWRQNILLNFSWFLCYFILMFMLRSTPQAPMPDMIWQG